jgi:hypothetical protein
MSRLCGCAHSPHNGRARIHCAGTRMAGPDRQRAGLAERSTSGRPPEPGPVNKTPGSPGQQSPLPGLVASEQHRDAGPDEPLFTWPARRSGSGKLLPGHPEAKAVAPDLHHVGQGQREAAHVADVRHRGHSRTAAPTYAQARRWHGEPDYWEVMPSRRPGTVTDLAATGTSPSQGPGAAQAWRHPALPMSVRATACHQRRI